MRRCAQYKGFSAVELLVVIAIIGVLSLVSAGTFVGVRQSQDMKVATQDAWLVIRSARNATLTSDTDRAYGVHVDATSITRFAGATYTFGSSTNMVTVFPKSVSATTSLSTGGGDVVFTRLTGEASATGTITLMQSATGATSSISIGKSGLVDIIR